MPARKNRPDKHRDKVAQPKLICVLAAPAPPTKRDVLSANDNAGRIRELSRRGCAGYARE